MRKRIITMLMCLSMALTLTGCNENKLVSVNVESDSSISGTVFGTSALIKIGDRLWYDSTTCIVYWWNGHTNGYGVTTPSPYYAPNGFPYRYDPETNTFEEI